MLSSFFRPLLIRLRLSRCLRSSPRLIFFIFFIFWLCDSTIVLLRLTSIPPLFLLFFLFLSYFFSFLLLFREKEMDGKPTRPPTASSGAGTLSSNLNSTFKKVLDLQSLDERGQVMVRHSFSFSFSSFPFPFPFLFFFFHNILFY